MYLWGSFSFTRVIAERVADIQQPFPQRYTTSDVLVCGENLGTVRRFSLVWYSCN